MKKKYYKKVLCCLCTLFMIFSSFSACMKNENEENTEDKLNIDKMDIISKNAPYAVSYPGIDSSFCDRGRELTDGKFPEPSEIKKEKDGWVGVTVYKEKNIYLDKGVPYSYYIDLDLETLCSVGGVDITFGGASSDEYNDIDYPEKVEIFASKSGAGYSYLGEAYPNSQKRDAVSSDIRQGVKPSGERAKYRFICDEIGQYKNIKAVVYPTPATKNVICEFEVYGKRELKHNLISKGAKYTSRSIITGESQGELEDDGKKLFDGEYFSMDYNTMMADEKVNKASIASFTPLLTNTTRSFEHIIELKKLDDVDEVNIRVIEDQYLNRTGQNLEAVQIFSSEDGNKYSDFGMAYVYDVYGNENTKIKNYRCQRLYNIKAKYIKIRYIGKGVTSIDEIEIFNSEVDEKKKTEKNVSVSNIQAESAENDNNFSYYNVALGSKIISSNNIKNAQRLTDGKYSDMLKRKKINWAQLELYNDKMSEFTVDLNKIATGICGVNIEIADTNIKPVIKVSVSENNSDFFEVGTLENNYEIAGKRLYRGEFEKKTAQYVKFSFESGSGNVLISEVQIFDKKAHEPFIRGGFMQVPILQGTANPYYSYKFTQNEWEYQFTLMKDAGMDTAIIQYAYMRSINSSLYPNCSVDGANFSGQSDIAYASEDPIKSIMLAADKVGMKVFLGTATDTGFYGQLMKMSDEERKEWLNKEVENNNIVVKDLFDRYAGHKSFAGFYLPDETCDFWMKWKNGTGYKDARSLYERESNYIRSLDPNIKIMISPAIWRGSSPEQFAKEICEMLKDGAGGKPIVDIVAAQDCLGREKMTDEIYNEYEKYIDEAAGALRSIGIEFWNDTEIFHYDYQSPKVFNEIRDSINLEMKQTNKSIVFDIFHYFDSHRGNFDEVTSISRDYVAREYIKFYENYKNTIKMK